jgi:hypothetical protein
MSPDEDKPPDGKTPEQEEARRLSIAEQDKRIAEMSGILTPRGDASD